MYIKEFNGGVALTGEHLWALVVYELLFLRKKAQVDSLRQRLLQKKLSKDQIIVALTKLDYETLNLRLHLYDEYFRPAFVRANFKTELKNWSEDLPNSCETWIAQYPDQRGYPWTYAEDFYVREFRI